MIPLRSKRFAVRGSRYETGVRVGGPRVGLNDRHCQAEVRDAPPGDGDIRGVDLDEGAGHSSTVLRPALLEHAEDVVALAGARAEYANRAGCPVQPVLDGSLDTCRNRTERLDSGSSYAACQLT